MLPARRGVAKVVARRRGPPDFLKQLAKAKARGVPCVLQVRTRQAWQMRWSSLLACSSARAFALSLLDRRAVVGVDGDTPSSSDVVGDICHVPLSGFACVRACLACDGFRDCFSFCKKKKLFGCLVVWLFGCLVVVVVFICLFVCLFVVVVVLFVVVLVGWLVGWLVKLVQRFDDFAIGDWEKLLQSSDKCDEEASRACTRKRRRQKPEDDITRRAARALALVQMGKLSAGRQALEGADLAPGNMETLRE